MSETRTMYHTHTHVNWQPAILLLRFAVVLLLSQAVHALCTTDEFGNTNCSPTISPGAAFGISVGVFAFVAITLSLITRARRNRIREANMTYVRNAQVLAAQQEQLRNQPYTPYSPPPGPPPGITHQHTHYHSNSGNPPGPVPAPAYDPTNAPQYPPPTYSTV